MRGIILWGIWIVVASVVFAPQRVLGQGIPSLIGDVPPEPADPVIVEPIRPLFPQATGTIPTARECGTVEVLIMSAGALFLLLFNFTDDFVRARRKP